MLSDVLSEALSEIERHYRPNASAHDTINEWLGSVIEAVRDLQIHLDTRIDLKLPEFERVEGNVGHYISCYSFGVIRCTVSRKLRTTFEARTNPRLFKMEIMTDCEFRTCKEGLVREAVAMAARLRGEPRSRL